jgi:hypothetical protein
LNNQGGKGIVSPEAENCNSFKAEMLKREKCGLLKEAFSEHLLKEARGAG